ncbi:hypothetical protein B9G69_007715 [Bdellovibrio sp. SKB1291214]|uniref:hypothetical protein n=1 Tax=Bdellovibrio sp. SKB1291214 TaxID=1732569 RepID=UPI000B516D06|nr:hypothetical protein [Bdellovibrio sp. SKB1291214]UYL10464.1 hypothetical protein B9G69_007715 [Bdellovibrio sp. SKB1291214]
MGFKFWLKIAFMIGSFGLVIYGMKQLRSSEFARDSQKEDSALALLLGGDTRPLNWCLADTKKVEIYSGKGEVQKTLESAQDISSVCEILIGPISAEAVQKSQFLPRLIATDAKGAKKTLEQAPNSPFFRVDDMPMSSTVLEKVLQRLAQP